MELPPIITSFLSYKRVIQNCSPLTVEEYAIDLKTFFKYIMAVRNGIKVEKESEKIDQMDIMAVDEALAKSITTDEVYSFLLYILNIRENKSASRARKLSAIKAFYKYHNLKSRKFTENPVKDIESPNIKNALPKYLSMDESVELLNSIKVTSDSKERDYCILTLFLNCGMRLSELVNINLNDISDDLTQLTVTGKGSKMRTIYLNTACRTALKDYLKIRGKKIAQTNSKTIDENALFLSRLNRRISNKTVQWMVKKQMEMCDLDKKGYSTHKLRHTAATLMYNSGNVDIRALKDILGHEQLTTTQIYTHVSDEKLKQAMEFNPLAKIKKGKNYDVDKDN